MIQVMLIGIALVGCNSQPDEPADGIVLLSPREQLVRLSVDLRGVHPSEQDLLKIDADPALYADFADRWMKDDRFLDRMETVFNQRFWTRTGDLYNLEMLDDSVLRGVPEAVAADEIAEEPLRLVRRIVDEDLPYSDLVTAPYTMADPTVAALWGIDIPDNEAGAGWQEGHYHDGRAESGMLTMTTTWTRYPSAGVNHNRHRANNLSRMLLCDDYLARPVAFSRTQIDALVSGDPEDVIRDTPTCQSCHSSMDPLAANFFGFWWEVDGDFRDSVTYRPEDEDLWREFAQKGPAYFGRPTHGIEELADQIAEDPRFVDCAVQTVFTGLTQQDVSDADWNTLYPHRTAFTDSGLVIRELVRSIVMSRQYRAMDTTDGDLGESLVTVKQADPAQLAGIIGAITDYRWTFDGRDGLTTNDLGLVVLGGGIDSRYVTVPSHDPSVGIVFIQERLAQAAAWHVAEHDLDPDRTEDPILLKYVNVNDTPDSNPEAFDGQIRALYLAATGIPLAEDASEPADLQALWKQLYSVEASPQQAWAGVVSVVLRDPRVLFY
jgi:hypothetical protein